MGPKTAQPNIFDVNMNSYLYNRNFDVTRTYQCYEGINDVDPKAASPIAAALPIFPLSDI